MFFWVKVLSVSWIRLSFYLPHRLESAGRSEGYKLLVAHQLIEVDVVENFLDGGRESLSHAVRYRFLNFRQVFCF